MRGRKEGGAGEFLRACRARLRPEDVGLMSGKDGRRVPGLRREELAGLAGMSVSYLIRLEQGRAVTASDEVIDALADALLLDDGDRAHLADLIRVDRYRPRIGDVSDAVEEAGDSIRLMVAGLNAPAWVIGSRGHVLTWNRLAHALLAWNLDFSSPRIPGERPNLLRYHFLDPLNRRLYLDWERTARSAVAYIWTAMTTRPDDPVAHTLVDELCQVSADFARFWAERRLGCRDDEAVELSHPILGRLTVTQQYFSVLNRPDHRLLIVVTEPGSASERAVERLARRLLS
ncbi:helix-turn-helix domain-containing protein [Amycolatopsis sp. lyj-90]|uniref:MmyB family transcriptional regulator n=1 Tax=Amycolatopsis sp. lyj-90 TaxID=2789285 RepID=UPI0039780BE6